MSLKVDHSSKVAQVNVSDQNSACNKKSSKQISDSMSSASTVENSKSCLQQIKAFFVSILNWIKTACCRKNVVESDKKAQENAAKETKVREFAKNNPKKVADQVASWLEKVNKDATQSSPCLIVKNMKLFRKLALERFEELKEILPNKHLGHFKKLLESDKSEDLKVFSKDMNKLIESYRSAQHISSYRFATDKSPWANF